MNLSTYIALFWISWDRLQVADAEVQRLQDGLEQTTAQKAALERDVAALQTENASLRANGEALAAEKWDIANANADLQNRLQTVSYMKVRRYFLGIFEGKRCQNGVSSIIVPREYPTLYWKKRSENYT